MKMPAKRILLTMSATGVLLVFNLSAQAQEVRSGAYNLMLKTLLKKAGYHQVKNLYGGIFEWVNEGRPVYDSTGITQRVHAYNHVWGIWLKKGKKVY